MISSDVKSNIKQQEIKYIVAVPSIQCKKGVYFSIDFGWYSVHLDFVH